MSEEKPKKIRQFKLQGYHFKAIAMRFYGKTHEEIRDALDHEYNQKFAIGTIRNWFNKNGSLEAAYNDFYKKETHRMMQATRADFTKLVKDVPKALREVLTKRKVIDAFGQVIKDDDGKPKIKYDGVTVKASELILKTVGIDIGEMSDDDLIDEMMDKIEAISDKQIADEQAKIEKDTK